MDLTGWLEYFVTGLATQLEEVKTRGKLATQVDVLVREHHLNERQTAALLHVLEEGELSIRVYAQLFPQVSRRTLQRDLRSLVEKGLFVSEGATNQLIYRVRETG